MEDYDNVQYYTFNVWGSVPTDINADEFCQRCEREFPYHYSNCDSERKSF